MVFRTFQAFLDGEDLVRIEMDMAFFSDDLVFSLENPKQALSLLEVHHKDKQVLLTLQSPEKFLLDTPYWIYDQDRNKAFLNLRDIIRQPIFDELFAYEGDDLGANYTPNSTHFRFWAPISEQVFILLGGQSFPLSRGDKGVWQTTLQGDFEGQAYSYLHKVQNEWREVHDPYALASEANSGRSFVIDKDKISQPISRVAHQVKPTKAIIYEMSVRDFSMQQEANFTQAGKFQGLLESPRIGEQVIGMEYLKQLGITHIQLMPLYDFGSVDEKHPELSYNWGYDPVQYNLPDGSFATDPDNPYSRIIELQGAISAYHQADISVIMDVVYNHVYNASTYAFEQIVPGYFFRYDENRKLTNGTFCGNDVASERAMVRSYLKQSLKQWVELYGFDGFRFDLMGILDIKTMTEIASDLKAIYPNIYLYGEGWQMPTGLEPSQLAHQFNADKLPDYGFFSDHFRDTIKETILDGKKISKELPIYQMENILTANIGLLEEGHFTRPQQAINYVECHDDATAFDYFKLKHAHLSEEERYANSRLALHIVLLAQGVPFIHSGQETFRTKNLVANSYNSPDSINHLDWIRICKHAKDVDFIRELIAFRKAHPLLSLETADDIKEACQVEWLSEHLLRYTIQTQNDHLTILINFSNEEIYYDNPKQETLILRYPTVGLEEKQDRYVLPAKQVMVLK
ncbi:type I pullulanase [Streptococcus himalayensis]|uniref:Type I pullulanase n=1 Tax=Streptococcus himalayensis TaxID=1888195 RepID=A0A917A2J7_9STRE|nr:type I pullulanase [Streptococcus himalayensis]GGE23362.1 type I pullulanase [Streptococcus himalayensis]